jgi:hypothetical protein
VIVAVGINDAVGVTIGTDMGDAHEERINVRRKRAMMEGVALFRMGCILTKKLPPSMPQWECLITFKKILANFTSLR